MQKNDVMCLAICLRIWSEDVANCNTDADVLVLETIDKVRPHLIGYIQHENQRVESSSDIEFTHKKNTYLTVTVKLWASIIVWSQDKKSWYICGNRSSLPKLIIDVPVDVT